MTAISLLDACPTEQGTLERVRYFPRQLLTADDMATDQDYFRQKLRRHNRFLHGWGTVCGLEVIAAPTDELPWRVRIEPGYALGPWGDEIYVGEAVHLDLARCIPGTVTDPCEPDRLHTSGSGTGGQLFLAVKYAECLAQPVRTMPAGCACEEEACEYSRIRDSFQIECLAELPPSHQPSPTMSLCDLINSQRLPACPPCPDDPWVVLAQVTLPDDRSKPIGTDNIFYKYRRQIYSTAMLQEQLIACCCQEADLEISKVADGDTSPLTYTLTITNKGPSTARNVIVDDTINVDGHVRVQAESFSVAKPPKRGLVIWPQEGANLEIFDSAKYRATIDILEPAESVELKFEASVQGTIKNTARVRSDVFDPNTDNNTSSTEWPRDDDRG